MSVENEKVILAEVQSLMQVIKTDREAQKQKELSERWTKWVSLWVVFLAVAGALTSQQQTSFSGKSTRELNQAAIEQGLATNTWSYYQSVSIKAHLYGLEARRKSEAALPPHIQAKLDKYDAQKKEILGKGRVHDEKRDVHRIAAETDSKHSRALGLAMSVLQVAVAMASISILAKRRGLFLLSILAGLLSIAQAVNGVLGLWV